MQFARDRRRYLYTVFDPTDTCIGVCCYIDLDMVRAGVVNHFSRAYRRKCGSQSFKIVRRRR